MRRICQSGGTPSRLRTAGDSRWGRGKAAPWQSCVWNAPERVSRLCHSLANCPACVRSSAHRA
eukprot:8097895-Prorocentrum_lima.AAC.1